MKKIDFIIVGTQKGATSALHHTLSQHEQISMSKQKELHFFDNDTLFECGDVDYEKYHAKFSSTDKLRGECTPIYAYWHQAIQRIWSYNSSIKLIFILRNPIERAFSHWNMEKQREAETLPFSLAIREEEQRSKEALPKQHRVYSYKDRGLYATQIRNILHFFPKDQVLFIKYEDMQLYPDVTLQEISDFLNIAPFKQQNMEYIFQLPYKSTLLYSDYLYLKDYFYYDIKAVEQLLDWNCTKWLEKEKRLKVLFYRDFRSYTGGHQIVYNYYCFLKQHPLFEPYIAFSKESIWDRSNPWFNEKENRVEYNPYEYDILFIAGEDWLQLDEKIEKSKTIINLIQGVRHARKDTKLYDFLNKKAYRITVSDEVKSAIEKEMKGCKGIITTIENGIALPKIDSKKTNTVYILALKNKPLASKIVQYLQEIGIEDVVVTYEKTAQNLVHQNMASSSITLLLPFHEEGFYIPALEAMQYSDMVIVPDCIGNRSFCINNYNVIMPKQYTFEAIKDALEEALLLLNSKERLEILKKNMRSTCMKYTISRQKKEFFHFLEKFIV